MLLIERWDLAASEPPATAVGSDSDAIGGEREDNDGAKRRSQMQKRQDKCCAAF
jgi:hypothetical protein